MHILSYCVWLLLLYQHSEAFAQQHSQKLLVVIAEGLSGSNFYKFSNIPAFKTFLDKGIWTKWLYPVFPTLPLPNRYTLLTGLFPSVHGLVGDYVYNSTKNRFFTNFTSYPDFDSSWWPFEPIFITTQKAGLSTAVFHLPECNVSWDVMPAICEYNTEDSTANTFGYTSRIIDAVRKHEVVIVNYDAVRKKLEKQSPKHYKYDQSVVFQDFVQVLERFHALVEELGNLNVMLICPHGYVEVPGSNNKILDYYLNMNLVDTTVGVGAVKQIITSYDNVDEVYFQLRHTRPIPGVKIYKTNHGANEIPEWYLYEQSDVVSQLVLIATPGYAIYTLDETKQVPRPSNTETKIGLSGYNNEYPDMLGLFLARGPKFKKQSHLGPLNIVEVYKMICVILELRCPYTNIDLTGTHATFRDNAKNAQNRTISRCNDKNLTTCRFDVVSLLLLLSTIFSINYFRVYFF